MQGYLLDDNAVRFLQQLYRKRRILGVSKQSFPRGGVTSPIASDVSQGGLFWPVRKQTVVDGETIESDTIMQIVNSFDSTRQVSPGYAILGGTTYPFAVAEFTISQSGYIVAKVWRDGTTVRTTFEFLAGGNPTQEAATFRMEIAYVSFAEGIIQDLYPLHPSALTIPGRICP